MESRRIFWLNIQKKNVTVRENFPLKKTLPSPKKWVSCVCVCVCVRARVWGGGEGGGGSKSQTSLGDHCASQNDDVQRVQHPLSYIAVCSQTLPQKGGYRAPAPVPSLTLCNVIRRNLQSHNCILCCYQWVRMQTQNLTTCEAPDSICHLTTRIFHNRNSWIPASCISSQMQKVKCAHC